MGIKLTETPVCKWNSSYAVVLSDSQIRKVFVNGEWPASITQRTRDIDEAFVGAGTTEQRLIKAKEGVYGHEQRHVQSAMLFFRRLQRQMTAEENRIPVLMRDYNRAAARAAALQATAPGVGCICHKRTQSCECNTKSS